MSEDHSPRGSPVPGILQARTLEWVAISFSNASKWKVKVKAAQSCPTLSDLMDHSLPGFSIHGIFQARVLEWGAIAFSKIQSRLLQKLNSIWCERTITVICASWKLFPITKEGNGWCAMYKSAFDVYLLYIEFILNSIFNQRRQWHPTPVLLPGKCHGRRTLVGCSPWGR